MPCDSPRIGGQPGVYELIYYYIFHMNLNTNQFIGRNKSYLQLNIQFSAGVTTEATVINAFPRFLQP